eukprot:126856_1
MFKTGDKVDIYDEDYTESWHICTIVDCKEDSVKIHYDGYDDQFEEWLPISSKRVAPFTTYTLNYTEFDGPPDLSAYYPAPLFYYDRYHNKSYIIVAPSYKDKHIFAFDLAQHKFIEYCAYPVDMTPLWHAAAIDVKSDKLYIMSGANCDFAVLDLLSKEWTLDDTLVPLLVACRTVYIGGSFEEIHVFGDGNTITHFKYNKYDMLNPIEVLPGIDGNKALTNSALIYVEAQTRLMMFGGWNGLFLEPQCYDDIWVCDLKQYQHNDYEWRPYPLKMPHKQKHFACVQAFDALVFVFYCRGDLDKSIWCLDLALNQWFKSQKLFPSNFGVAHAVKTKHNDVHFMCCNWSDAPYHIQLSLYDVVPLELDQLYHNKYSRIVRGVIRGIQTHDSHKVIVPDSLIRIIVMFVPYFGF